MDDGRTESEGKPHVAEQGDGDVYTEPREAQEKVLGIVEADGHEDGVEQSEKCERGEEEAEMPRPNPMLDQESGQEEGHDENGDEGEHVGERRLPRNEEVQQETDGIDGEANQQGVGTNFLPARFAEEKLAVKQQRGRQIQQQRDAEEDETGGRHASFSEEPSTPSILKRRRIVSRRT